MSFIFLLSAALSVVSSETTLISSAKATIAIRSVGRAYSTNRWTAFFIKPLFSKVEPEKSSNKTRSNGCSVLEKNEISCSASFSRIVKSSFVSFKFAGTFKSCVIRRTFRLTSLVSILRVRFHHPKFLKWQYRSFFHYSDASSTKPKNAAFSEPA